MTKVIDHDETSECWVCSFLNDTREDYEECAKGHKLFDDPCSDFNHWEEKDEEVER